MSTIKYQYAYDENNNIIDIKNIDSEYRKEHSFHCIGCNGKMKANFCKTKTDYFSHYGDSCSSETYLHELAKKVFKQKFENYTSVLLQFEQSDLCDNHQTCAFYKFSLCSKKNEKIFDLKDFYNVCQEEKVIDKYKADLLLSDSKGKYKKPILIEIFVTHQCTEDKINSRLKIIEFKIESELDIRKLLDQPIKKDSERIKLYGFKEESNDKIQLGNRLIRKITFYDNGKYRVNEINCRSVSEVKKESESLIDIYLPKTLYNKDVSIASILAGRKCCFLCKYSTYHDKKKQIHPNCLNWQDPYKCNLYKEDSDKVERYNRDIKELQVLLIK